MPTIFSVDSYSSRLLQSSKGDTYAWLAKLLVARDRDVTMKSLLSMIVLTLSACATAPPPQYKPAGTSEPPGTAGSVAITGDELRRTGRTELGDAMRASSPIFR
jgi:hypothetical protein